jgi:HPt (histidine-containing phosphotransfer) domain-containing protein
MTKSSAVPVDRTDVPPSVADEPAIDVTHLARMTFGEQGLECEVLRLFDRQASMLLARMQGASLVELAAFAHTLKGSAHGIGAWQVAKAAEALEQAASAHDHRDLAGALDRLGAAVKVARAAITGRIAVLDQRRK